jgi:photosystem II stability/assembly factor-like uncharacterized protein
MLNATRKFTIVNILLSREKSSKLIVLSGCAFFLITFLFCNNSLAQWIKLPAPSFMEGIVYFQHSEGHPEIGFMGAWAEDENGNRDHPAELWKTSDGGKTWHRVSDPTWVGAVTEIFFNGWVSIGHRSQNPPIIEDGGLYRTNDGGETWSFVNGTKGHCSSVYYNPNNNLLFINFWGQASLMSFDDGLSWQKWQGSFPANGGNGDQAGNGFSFWDSAHGLTTKLGGINTPFLITSDGGLTWQESSFTEECWQPLSIIGTSIAFAFCEYFTQLLYRSDDYGMTWKQVFRYTTDGCIRGNLEHLITESTNGMFVSNDSGLTWYSICGPESPWDNRFQFVNDSIIAGGIPFRDPGNYLWINTTGIGSNSTPQLSTTSKIFNGLGCDSKFDSLITFTFFDSCNGIQATLVSASISGSNNFSFSSPSAIPRTIHPDDSLIISYNPASALPDTSQLHLRFHLGWKDFDTTIQLFGAGRIPKETVQFIPSSKNYSARSGSVVTVSYTPDKNISARNLDSISFDLDFDGDLLNYRSISTSIPGASISAALTLPLSRCTGRG